MNSFYQNTTFGTLGSSNRKLDVYNKPEIIKSNLTNLTTHQKKMELEQPAKHVWKHK